MFKYSIFEYSSFGLTLIYNRFMGIIEKFKDVWNKLPYRLQSLFLIILWIYIPGTFIYDLYVKYMLYGISWDIVPLLMMILVLTPLAIFYIVLELKGELRKRK